MGVTTLRRIFVAVAVFATLSTFVSPAHAGPGWRKIECRFQYADGRHGFTDREVVRTIRCATNKWDLSFTQAMEIARNESGLNEFARNPSSGACGVYQHIPTYFSGRVGALPQRYERLSRKCTNARANVLAALWMARRGWDPWCSFTTYC